MYYACRAIVEREISIILLRMVVFSGSAVCSGSGGEEETRMHYIRHHRSHKHHFSIIIIIVPMKNSDVDDVLPYMRGERSQEKRTFGFGKPFAFAPRIYKKNTDMHQSWKKDN